MLERFLDISSALVQLNNNTPTIKSDALVILTDTQRTILFCIYVVVVTIAVLGNLATIIFTSRRKHRPLQKAFILSLAMSDLNLAILYGLVNIVTVSERYSNWKLGRFMCHFVPYAQTFCLIANSMTLMSIGFDRYKNIVKSTDTRWNPNLCMAFIPIVVIWICSALIAYPITQWYIPNEIYVIMYDENLQPSYRELMLICQTTTDTKIDYKYYYIGIFAGIFLPLLLSFLWFYHKIALLVWKRRKPPGVEQNDRNRNHSSSTESTNTIQHQQQTVTVSPNVNVNFRPETRVGGAESVRNSGGTIQVSENKYRNMQLERKLRTFRIILVLMAVFLLCRLPFWCMSLARLMVTIDGDGATMTLYCLSALGLLNCALNPFLYTFLNETVASLTKVYKCFGACFRKVCCFFCLNIDSQDLLEGPCGVSSEPSRRRTAIPVPPIALVSSSTSARERNAPSKGGIGEGEIMFSKNKFKESPVLKMVLKNERDKAAPTESICGTYREIRF